MANIKSDVEKLLTHAERFLKELSNTKTESAVAQNSLYWATFHLQKVIVFLRDANAEREITTQDIMVFTVDGELKERISDPEEIWKFLHNVKETEDDRKRPWLRAYRT